jgi:ABC-type phosphate transport system permease subunit
LYISALVELGLILLVISLVVNGIARLLMWTVFRKTGRAA